MKGIQIRINREMKERGLIYRVPLQRRYSYDDFFLIDNNSFRSFAMNGPYNEFIGHGINYLEGDQYELFRKISRQKMLRQSAANKYKVVPFAQNPESYNKIFDLIIKFYTRVRDSITNLEEVWFFLMEIVYQ